MASAAAATRQREQHASSRERGERARDEVIPAVVAALAAAGSPEAVPLTWYRLRKRMLLADKNEAYGELCWRVGSLTWNIVGSKRERPSAVTSWGEVMTIKLGPEYAPRAGQLVRDSHVQGLFNVEDYSIVLDQLAAIALRNGVTIPG